MSAAVSKKGRHGTLYLFQFEYGDGEEVYGTCSFWGYDREHALERFNDGEEGFTAFRMRQIREHAPQGAWEELQ